MFCWFLLIKILPKEGKKRNHKLKLIGLIFCFVDWRTIKMKKKDGHT
jgi:hypothetical protein